MIVVRTVLVPPYAHMYTLGRLIDTCGLSYALYCAYIRNIIYFMIGKRLVLLFSLSLVTAVVIYLNVAYFPFQFNLSNLMMFIHLCSC